MIQFIFVFPVIYFLVKKHKTGGIIICGIVNAIYELLQCAYGMNQECYRLLVFRYILVIAAGCFASFDECTINRRYAVLASVCGIIFILANCYFSYTAQVIIYWTRTSFVASLYIIQIMIFLIRSGRIRCRVLELLGRASYNIFLVQMVYYTYGAGIVYRNVESRGVQLLLNISICLSVGVFFYYFETPITRVFLKHIKRLFKNWNQFS